jgi:uncharacterized protein YjbJ (UPF0337 family)
VSEDILRGPDFLKKQWKRLRAKSKLWWSKLTDDDLDIIDGRRDQLIDKLRERYGYSKGEAAREVNRRLKELDNYVESRQT